MGKEISLIPAHTRHLITWAAILTLFVIFLRAVEPVLLPFVLGALMAYLFDPVADAMERRGISRGVAAAIITFGFFSGLVALVVWVGPLLYAQLSELAGKLPAFLNDVEAALQRQAEHFFHEVERITNGKAKEPALAAPHDIIGRAVTLGGEAANSMVASSFALLNILSLLLITPIVAFYFLRDWHTVVTKADKLLPRAYASIIRMQAKEVNATLAGYLRGQLYVMMTVAVFYAAAFALIGLQYALFLGVLVGLLVIVPYIGTWVSAGTALLVAYGQFGTGTLFWAVLGVFVVGQILESQILTPKIIGDRVGLHPLWLLFGMLAGAVLIGFAGVLLAVPLTAVISVGVRFVVSVYLESPLYKGK